LVTLAVARRLPPVCRLQLDRYHRRSVARPPRSAHPPQGDAHRGERRPGRRRTAGDRRGPNAAPPRHNAV